MAASELSGLFKVASEAHAGLKFTQLRDRTGGISLLRNPDRNVEQWAGQLGKFLLGPLKSHPENLWLSIVVPTERKL